MNKLLLTELHWTGAEPFTDGFDMEFRGSLTYLIGRQGIGKTTLLRAISGRRHEFASSILNFGPSGRPHHSLILHIETEFDCPHVAVPTGQLSSIEDFVYFNETRVRSHGQVMYQLLKNLSLFDGRLILIDEPENGLSMESVISLRKIFSSVAKRNQLLVSTHHPFFIAHKGALVFDIEKREYIDGNAYVKSFLKKL